MRAMKQGGGAKSLEYAAKAARPGPNRLVLEGDGSPQEVHSSFKSDQKIHFMHNILDVKPCIECVIIGTLYKEMNKKPCVLKSLSGILRDPGVPKNYCAPEDFIVLEDSSGRIRIKNSGFIQPGNFVTGSIVGFKGQVDQNGIFDASDYSYAGFNPDHFLPLPESV